MKIKQCFNGDLNGFQGCLKEVEWMFEGSFQGVSTMFQGRLREIRVDSRELQMVFKGSSKIF